MKILTVSNQKGGVGKTTTAISLAGALAERGLRVLACDLDPQANYTLGLGLDPETVRPGMLELLTGACHPHEAVHASSVPEIRLIPSDLTLAGAERQLLGQIGFDEILPPRLAAIGAAAAADGHPYDVAIIDAPPSLGLLTVNAITAAHTVVVPVQCEYFSARGLGQLLELTDLVRARRRPDLEVLVLPTLLDIRNRICREILDELKLSFAESLLEPAIGIDTRLREAAAAGEPITRYASTSRAAKQYRAVVDSLATRGVVPAGTPLPEKRPRKPSARATPRRRSKAAKGKKGADTSRRAPSRGRARKRRTDA